MTSNPKHILHNYELLNSILPAQLISNFPQTLEDKRKLITQLGKPRSAKSLAKPKTRRGGHDKEAKVIIYI